jgi:hypothetical protein
LGKPATSLDGPPRRRRVTRRDTLRAARAVALAAGMLHGALLSAATPHAHDGEAFLICPMVTATQRSDELTALDVERREIDAGFSVFGARDIGRWRLLGEALISTDEQEIERAQAGWKLSDESMAWLGRFHNPLGFWNTFYHHGAYMQTSISRPGIFEYEDRDGPLPSHLTGMLFEGAIERGASGWYYELAAGAGPQLDGGLEPVNILRPADGNHELGTTLRLSFRPDADGRDEVGIYFGHTRIAGADEAPVDLTQQVAGGFVFWQWSGTALRAEALSVATEFDAPLGVRGSFVNAYLQLEQPWRDAWTVYGRLEGTRGADGDAYLAHFPRFVIQRELLGLRYELTRRQALKLEFGRVQLQSGADYNQLDLQWAAAFP